MEKNSYENYFYFIFILCIGIFGTTGFGQDTVIIGKATFVTSKNVYVKFENTKKIKIGDTLRTSTKTPCLIATNKSSNSVFVLR